MSTFKRWISLLLVLCLLLSVVPVTAHAINASGTCGENLTWILSNDGVLTISGSGAMESYASSIDTPWSKISDSIRTIQISDGTISIGDYAFAGLLYLTDVSISKSVEFIGKRAFCDCPKLQGIFVDPNNEFYCNDAAGVLFDKAQNILVSVPGALVGSYIIPEGVIIIEEAAFQFSDISEVLIPNSVEYIGAYAFWDCDNLRRLDFPDSIESIGEYAVANCSNLFAITMGDSIITIENAAFFNCTSLESVTIPDSVISIGDYAFNLYRH